MLDTGQDAADLVRQALTIGYDQLAGAVGGGIDAWRAAGLEVTSTELVDAAPFDRPVLDVRQDDEHVAGHIPDALHVELGDIEQRNGELPAGGLAVMCGHGERAATAASLLERAGRRDIAVVIGGPDDWVTGGRHLTKGP
jgi:rhodanese-related sulfurtransferase